MEKTNIENQLYINIFEKAVNLLRKYPLCDHCLGRVFAKHGVELSNDERGKAVKTILQFHIYSLVKNKSIDIDEVKTLAINAGEPLTRMYRKIFGEELSPKPCYICGNKLSREYYREKASMIAELLSQYDVKRFLVGVSISQDTLFRELDVYREVGLETSESIKNEIKREIGKLIRDKYGLEPDFEKPEAMVIIDFEKDTLSININPVLLEGRYWKRGRNISHVPWVSKGVYKYPYSLEQFFNDQLSQIYRAEKIVFHASGREDVDARMLGDGRPMVVEIKKPRVRNTGLMVVNKVLDTDLVKAVIFGEASRLKIKYFKGEASKKRKIYKILVYSESPLDPLELTSLENYFNNRVIKQYTPKRILRRKRERLRTKKVYVVKTVLLDKQLFEALVYCDGGLYVKEIVHGDDGRTTPSFSEFLNKKLYPIELDVIGMEI